MFQFHSMQFNVVRRLTSYSVNLGNRKMFNCSQNNSLIAVCQITANNNIEHNFKVCKNLIEEAAKRQAQVVFFPEACDFVGESIPETLSLSQPLDGELMKRYQELAKKNNIWISLGGIHEKISDTKVRNAHVLIENTGVVAAVYRKLHLFDVNLPEKGIRLQESDYVEAGNEIVDPVETPVGKIGLGVVSLIEHRNLIFRRGAGLISFAELGYVLRNKGADILTYPSAFTFATGASHWENLLRTRALENQCYVIAAAQVGAHNKKRTSWGHAMVIDPWGTVIAQCGDHTGLSIAEINLSYLHSVRQQIPVWNHRRIDMYPKFNSVDDLLEYPQDDHMFEFGHCEIRGSTIFYKTPLTMAFTNKKCVLPGHVLICPVRKAERLSDLSPEEVADLFQVVQKVQSVMEKIHETNSSTVVVQDGPEAGQTVKHLHVHILPRKRGDFMQNDEIYHKLQSHDNVDDPNPWREESEMTAEALMIRKYIK